MLRNMAATDPEESPKAPTSPSGDVEPSGQTNESTESGGAVHNTHETLSREARGDSGDAQGETLARVGGICVSHSRVSVECGAETHQATRKSSDEQKPVGNMTGAPVDEQRALDRCGKQEDDDEKTKTTGQETGMLTFDVLHH